MESREELLRQEYNRQLREECQKFNKRKMYCAHLSRDGIIYGMVAGVGISFGLAQLVLSHWQDQEEIAKKNNLPQLSSHTTLLPQEPKSFGNRLTGIFKSRSMRGIGLIIGTVGTLSGYFVSRSMYENCIETYMASMRKVAELRHEHYFNQVVYSQNDETDS